MGIYPPNWPTCAFCDKPVLDGHATCGGHLGGESAARAERDAQYRAAREPPDPGQRGPCPGHEFVCTGTAYGGDDERYHGEGRSYCIHCGADGDA